jgi:hypothetical protein
VNARVCGEAKYELDALFHYIVQQQRLIHNEALQTDEPSEKAQQLQLEEPRAQAHTRRELGQHSRHSSNKCAHEQ